MTNRSQEDGLYALYPEKGPVTSVMENETTTAMTKSRLESLPAELLENILQGISLSQCAILCSVSSKIRSFALGCVQVISNQGSRYPLSQILPRYKEHLSKFQIKELDIRFSVEVPSNYEYEELSQLMALLASLDCCSVQKATLVLNRFSGTWFTDFSKFASNSLTELKLTATLQEDKTADVLLILLDHFPNLNTLKMESNVMAYHLQPESEREGLQHEHSFARHEHLQHRHDFTRHENLTSLDIYSDIGALGIDIHFFKRVPKLCTLRMHGDINDSNPDILYRTLIADCPGLKNITYIDAGFEFMASMQEELGQEISCRLLPKRIHITKEDRQPSGAEIKRQFYIYGDDRTQKAKSHVKAVQRLYYGPLTEDEFEALYKTLPQATA